YSVLHKKENAHEESIWSCSWGRTTRERKKRLMINKMVKMKILVTIHFPPRTLGCYGKSLPYHKQ
ncbi:hypothetical protein NQ315_002831, partial [Exocentrus adspersus]